MAPLGSSALLRYNPSMVDSLKCLFFIMDRPRKEGEIRVVEDSSVRIPVLESEDIGSIRGAGAVGRLFWDPLFNYRVTEWLEFSKFEIVPYFWSGNYPKLKESLRYLNESLKSSKFLLCDLSPTVADASLAIDLTPPMIKDVLSAEEFPEIERWYDAVSHQFSSFHEIARKIRSLLMTPSSSSNSSSLPRILCVHGYKQNSYRFKQKIGAFRKLIKKKAEFVYVQSPLIVGEAESNDENDITRGWWNSDADKTLDQSSVISESKDLILKTLSSEKIDGILCFSQGAALIAWMAIHGMFKECPIKFIIFIATYKSERLKYEDSPDVCGIPSLHVIGSDDNVIIASRSKEMLKYFDRTVTRVMLHSGGHFVPAKSNHKQLYLNFIENNL